MKRVHLVLEFPAHPLTLTCFNLTLYSFLVDFYSALYSPQLPAHPGPSLRRCYFSFVEHLRLSDMATSDSHESTSNFPISCYHSPSPIHPPVLWIPSLQNFLFTKNPLAFWNLQSLLSQFSLSLLHTHTHTHMHTHTHKEAIIIVSLSLLQQYNNKQENRQ